MTAFKTQITMEVAPTIDAHITTKRYVDDKFRDFDFQGDVLNIQTDATLDPGAAPTTGDRYIITNSAALHANFGAITMDWAGNALALGNNDIVEYNGTTFRIVYDVSAKLEGAMVWNRNTDAFLKWSGVTWSVLISSVKYTNDFLIAGWVGGAAPYTLTIAAAIHGLGTTKALAVTVYEDGAPNTRVGCDLSVADNGTVVISSAVKFDGHYVIM